MKGADLRWKDRTAARPGSLGEPAASAVAMLRRFYAKRDELLRRLFGGTVRRDPLRDEVIRIVVLAFAQDRPLYINEVIRECRRLDLGRPTTTRTMVHGLREAGVIVLQPGARDARRTVILPTVALIRFYRTNVSAMLAELVALARIFETEQGDMAPKSAIATQQ